jgi:hypothetical protein
MRPSKDDLRNAGKKVSHRDNIHTDRQLVGVAKPGETLYLIQDGTLVSEDVSQADGNIVVGTYQEHSNGHVKYHVKMNQMRQVFRTDAQFQRESETFAQKRKMTPYKMVLTNKSAFEAYQKFLSTGNPAIARLAESLLAG